MIDLALRQRGAFSPRALFRDGAAGAWYDPSDLASMAQNGDGTVAAAVDQPVALLRDKSGNGNHALHNSASVNSRPMLRRDGAGRLCLEFDGVDDELRVAFACPNPWDRLSAIRQLSSAGSDRIFGAVAAVSSLAQGGTAPDIFINDGGGFLNNGGAAIGANVVVAERHDGANSRLAVNGGAAATGDIGANAADGISLGSAGTAVGGRFGHFRLYGVLMIGRALGDAETARLRRFMAARAGVAL